MQFPGVKPDDAEARVLIEKKTVINLTEAFAVAVKHYLRGEEGIDYADLYHLVKYLPFYPLPAGMPSQADLHAVPGSPTSQSDGHGLHKRKGQSTEPTPVDVTDHKGGVGGRRGSILDDPIFPAEKTTAPQLPLPATSPGVRLASNNTSRPSVVEKTASRDNGSDNMAESKTSTSNLGPPPSPARARLRKSMEDLRYLKPAYLSPGFGWSDFFPSFLTKRYDARPEGGNSGRRSAKQHAKYTLTHNMPLEISLYLSSYVSALQSRQGAVDGPTVCTFCGCSYDGRSSE